MSKPGPDQSGLADADNWFGVQNPRKRKQIQDRLAQRAHRKRLGGRSYRPVSGTLDLQQSNGLEATRAAAMPLELGRALAPGDGETPDSSNHSSSNETTGSSPGSSVSWPLNPSTSDRHTTFVFDELFVDIPATSLSVPSVPMDQRVFPTPQLSVFAAMWDNGAMLGLSCCCDLTWKSKPVASDIPVSLHPTSLQQMKAHFTWIDRFPFPRMRDNMISLSGTFDEEDFLESLFKQPSFTLKPGGLSWDPQAWKIAIEFEAKWGYLFY